MRCRAQRRLGLRLFLCLAREAQGGLHDRQFLVLPLVNQAIAQQRHLLSGKCVELEFDDPADAGVRGHPQAFAIAVNNLVRNAFEHAPDGQGPIHVRIQQHELFVTNQVRGDAEQADTTGASSAEGHGLGLGIVQRLCEHNGWSFSLQADEARVAARLSW